MENNIQNQILLKDLLGVWQGIENTLLIPDSYIYIVSDDRVKNIDKDILDTLSLCPHYIYYNKMRDKNNLDEKDNYNYCDSISILVQTQDDTKSDFILVNHSENINSYKPRFIDKSLIRFIELYSDRMIISINEETFIKICDL